MTRYDAMFQTWSILGIFRSETVLERPGPSIFGTNGVIWLGADSGESILGTRLLISP